VEGKRFSHFLIEELLGEGGMGRVYKATDESLRRTVALKVLLPEFARNPERRQRFLREAQAAAAVSDPSIAAVYEVGEDGEDAFIAMEYVQGKTLRAVAQDGPLEVGEAIRVASEIAKALERAHQSGVIHRDLKPENVMLGDGGAVKILDFGLAKIREAPRSGPLASELETKSGNLTREGTILGTVAYMSPEQARGQRLDPRSDIFSLGVVLYELLTGLHPFRGETSADTLSAVLKENPPPPSRSNPEVLPALDALLERMLEKEPAGRPASAQEVRLELKSLDLAPQAPESPEGGSVAVLPFADMSPEKDQDYFCEGIAEELINALAHVEGLKVASRTSAFQFKGKADDIRRIGQKLGVATVLEGSVRKAGTRLRVTVQLVSTANGYHLWSERYDRDTQDIFALQDEIAQSLVQALKIRLGHQRPVRRATESVEAYHLYLQGRYFWNKRYEGGLKRSVEFFEAAIEKDPSYALAHAGLADAYSVIGYYTFLPSREAFSMAKEASDRAVALDPSLAEAHVSRALVAFWFEWDFPRAEAEFRQAILLKPTHVPAYMFLGQLMPLLARTEEAAPLWQKALELDPLGPLTHGIVGSGHVFARQEERAVEECSKALALDPNHVQSLWAISMAYSRLGRAAEALAAADRMVSLGGRSPFFLGIRGALLAILGKKDEARSVVRELDGWAGSEYVAPCLKGFLFAALGDAREALDSLERAYEERNPLLICLAAWREFDFLRGEARFRALVKTVGLPMV
jgi:serine/threonine-protein kinase